MKTMTIGQLARTCATPVETIRHYEREGLLAAPPRSVSNYRLYGAAHAEQLRFIRHCRALDMALPEIAALLAIKARPGPDCRAANAVIDAHLDHVQARLRELAALRRQLQALRQRCPQPGPVAECGILDRLARESPPGDPIAATAGRATRHVRGTHG